MAACGHAEAQSIAVDINNRSITFEGAGPIQRNGAVLVPLRGVFDALGATVIYDAAAKTVVAQKGESIVTLAVGSAIATVDGHNQTLSQPAVVINGSTFIPLRFVAEALGSEVQWLAQTSTIQIITPEAHLSTLPPPPVTAATPGLDGRVVGQLTGIYTDTVPESITLRVNGVNTVVPLSSNSTVLVRNNDQPAQQSNIKALEIGDQVRVSLSSSGSATTIEAVYGEVIGTVKSVQPLPDGTYLVNLNDGSSVTMAADADVEMAGRAIAFADIMPAERVRIRTDQLNRVGYSLVVVTEDRTGDNASARPNGQVSASKAAIEGPRIYNESPRDGAVVTTSVPIVYALIDKASATDGIPSSIELNVDGVNVTPEATVTSNFVTYQPKTPLATGTHTVAISIKGACGVSNRVWSFDTIPQCQPMTFTSNRSGQQICLHKGQSVALTLTAEPGGSAFAAIGSYTVPLSEIKPGTYVGHVSPGTCSGIQGVPVIAHYTAPDNSASTEVLAQSLSIDSGAPLPPTIKSPADGQQLGKTVQVAGLSLPSSRVYVKIGYTTKALGMIGVTGTAAQTVAMSDAEGKWQTSDLRLVTPTLFYAGHGINLTISAYSVTPSGQQSTSSSIQVLSQ